MHTFKFIQEGELATGCEILLDDRPLLCEEFKISAKAGHLTYLNAKIALSDVEIDINGKVLTIDKTYTKESHVPDTEITFK